LALIDLNSWQIREQNQTSCEAEDKPQNRNRSELNGPHTDQVTAMATILSLGKGRAR